MHIHSSTFQFLAELKENNSREWFLANKSAYEAAHANIIAFIEAMIKRLASFDMQINTDIKASKCLFRIYRDIRFSKDKTPYKSWLAAGISIDGRKLDGPEYYLHVEPGKTFLAAGYWRPNKQHLDGIRQELDYNNIEFTKALAEGGWSTDDLWQEDKLVRPPAGYDAADPIIELLKLKSFILQRDFTDAEMQGEDAIDQVIKACEDMYPFKVFIHQAITNDN